MGIYRTAVRAGWTCIFLFTFTLASSAGAEWRLYGDFELGISTATGKTGGSHDNLPPQIPDPSGSDSDSSPLIGVAVGMESPLDQATPWNPPFGLRWPRWTVRSESEFVFLRDYEYKTPSESTAAGQFRFTQTDSWTFMQNFLVDMPLLPLYRPITWVSKRLRGPARLPSLKRVLRPMSFDAGAGVGFSSTDLLSTDNTTPAKGKGDLGFAWQARAGFGYEVTRHVTLMAGYRYVDLGTTGAPLLLAGAVEGRLTVDQTAHEFRAGIRVYYFEFDGPWH